MATDPQATKAGMTLGGSLEFHYQKTSQYRVIHADGAVGGPTPRGLFAMTFFSERPPIPKVGKRSVVEVLDNGVLMGPEEVVEVIGGVVRQIDTTVMMDLRAAQELYQLFGEQLAIAEKAAHMSEADRVTRD